MANCAMREVEIPVTELIIGGTWEPDQRITIDISGAYRFRAKDRTSVTNRVFDCHLQFLDHLLDGSNEDALAWSKGNDLQ